MPPPRKKPHPRSLDALFPVPAVKRCARGHSQTPQWTGPCSTCRKIEEAESRVQWVKDNQLEAKAEREAASAALKPLPDPYVLWTHDGTRQVFRAARGRRRRR